MLSKKFCSNILKKTFTDVGTKVVPMTTILVCLNVFLLTVKGMFSVPGKKEPQGVQRSWVTESSEEIKP